MAVVATLNILTKVSTGGLTAGFKQASNSVQAFASKMLGLNHLVKGALAYFGSKAMVKWISGSMEELAKTERGAYNTIEAFKGVKKVFQDWGQVISRELAPYLEVAAKGLVDLLNASTQFGAEAAGFKSAGEAIRTMVGYLATAAQVVTLVFQAFASGIYTVIEQVAKLIGAIAELEKKLPKSMQLGLSDQIEPFVLDVQNAAEAARKATAKNFNDLLDGNTWGKQLEEAAEKARKQAIAQGPPLMKPAEPAAAMVRGSKEAYSASLKSDRMMKGAADVQVAELKKVNKHLGDVDPILRDIRAGVRDKWGIVIKPAEL